MTTPPRAGVSAPGSAGHAVDDDHDEHERGRTSFMSLHGLLDAVTEDPALTQALKAAGDGHLLAADLVGPPAARPFTVAALARET
ncbi:hypothetical protein ACQ5JZ_19425, partial [Streptomyces sp. ZG43]